MSSEQPHLEFVKQLLDAYASAADYVLRVTKSWILAHQRLLISSNLQTRDALTKKIREAHAFWTTHNLFISGILKHVLEGITKPGPDRESQRDDQIVDTAFRKVLNLFLAVKVGYTVRTVFSTGTEPGDFDSTCFPFITSDRDALKPDIMRRIMQLAFADGSYEVDFGTEGMQGVIGKCYTEEDVHVDNDVFQSKSEYSSRTPEADTDLGISSILYIPVGPDTRVRDIILGLYSPVKGLFNEELDGCLHRQAEPYATHVRELQLGLAGMGAMARVADALETGLKSVTSGIVLSTTQQLADMSSFQATAKRAIYETQLRHTKAGETPPDDCSLKCCKLFGRALLEDIEHHGDMQLPLVGRDADKRGKTAPFDLKRWWNEDVEVLSPQVVSNIRNHFTLLHDPVTLPQQPVWVTGDKRAACAVLHAIIHNAMQHRRPDEERANLDIRIGGPSEGFGYGVVRITTWGESPIPENLTSAQWAILLKQGIPLPTEGGHGFGLFWSRCILEAYGGRLHIGWPRISTLNMRDRITALVTAKDKHVDERVRSYRNGWQVTLCFGLAP